MYPQYAERSFLCRITCFLFRLFLASIAFSIVIDNLDLATHVKWIQYATSAEFSSSMENSG